MKVKKKKEENSVASSKAEKLLLEMAASKSDSCSKNKSETTPSIVDFKKADFETNNVLSKQILDVSTSNKTLPPSDGFNPKRGIDHEKQSKVSLSRVNSLKLHKNPIQATV